MTFTAISVIGTDVFVVMDSRSSCCARAASGHAAAPPSVAKKFRRPMVTVIRPSRARCVDGTIARHERAVPNSAAAGVGGAS